MRHIDTYFRSVRNVSQISIRVFVLGFFQKFNFDLERSDDE